MMGYAPQQQQQWNQQQQQQWNQQQQQQWNQQTQQQSWQAAAPAAAAATDNTIGTAANIVVTGCTHATVGVIARGSYTLNTENHGRRAYKRDSQVNGLDVMIYFWDERDGPNFCGWWFGPKVGGDQVWAYHPDKSAQTPPKNGWKVPYDGPVDPTFLISPSKPGAGAATSQQQAAAAQQQQQNQWQQQSQQQNQWQQPAQQQNQWQAQQAALAQQKQAQQKLLEEQKNQQLEEQKKKFAAMREQQMAQQKQRLEENRQKLEEANKKRIEEQQQKMAALKAQQEMLAQKAAEEKKKKEEEMIKKREEARAALAVRKVIQKLRIAQGREATWTAKLELEEIMEKEGEALYTMKDKIKEEGDQAIKLAETRIEQIEAVKRKAEELKAAEEKKLQEQKEKAEQLVAELAGLVAQADEANKTFTAESEPLTSSADLTVEQIQAAGESCEAAGAEVKLKSKACTDFISKNSKEMKPPPAPAKPKVEGEDTTEAADKPQLKDLLQKMAEIQRSSEALIKNIAVLKPKAEKKASAKKKLNVIKKTFTKYDKDSDGMLNKKELVSYAKGEFAFSVASADADSMCKMLVEEGATGVPAESFTRVRAYVGILREKAKDAKRKEKRLAHEKEVEDMKEKLKTTIEEVSTVVTEATEKIKDMEAACVPLPSKLKTMKSKEMGPLADESAALVEAVKSLVAKARKMIADLGENSKEELKGFIASESAKLTSRMAKFDGHITKCESIISKFRTEVSKKDKEELEAFRLAAIKKIRKYQKDNQVKTEDVFKKLDKKGTGKVNEADFVKFLATTCKSSTPDVEEEEEEVELLQEEMSRLFAYLDEEEDGALTAEIVTSLIRCYMKVAKETVITTEKNIQEAKPIRRLEVGEVCYVIEGPVKEDTVDVMRYLVKSLKDETEGWVTPVGNQGTKFLEEAVGGLIMKVVKETILTASFEICSDAGKEQFRKLKDTTRKLKPGEQVEVLQWMKKDETSGLMRAKVKTKVGNHVGWATAVGNNGAPFLELA